MKADLTGTVWKVLVQPGDVVDEDATLIILESMKMEITVVAPRPGTVKEVLAIEGEVVEETKVLVVLD